MTILRGAFFYDDSSYFVANLFRCGNEVKDCSSLAILSVAWLLPWIRRYTLNPSDPVIKFRLKILDKGRLLKDVQYDK